jgi:hypothetical protein
VKAYDFTLKLDLPDANTDPEQYIDALYEAGCDDATVGIGQRGRIGLNFIRTADSAVDALVSAIRDVTRAIPGARLTEAAPDLVGLTDVAEIVGCTRQNMRKLFLRHVTAFPAPVHQGNPALWHLAKVLKWLKATEVYDVREDLIEVSSATMQVNLASQMRDVEPALQRRLATLLP